ncbi:TIGR04255 family protein [Chloroflexota bacterium]
MPKIRPLPKKPLVEAIFELRWNIPSEEGDPNYSLFIGRLFDRLEKEYPYYESLPTSLIPAQAAGQIAQHRFRTAENGWPLVQVGPGLVTVNDTDSYIWKDFGDRIRLVIDKVYEAYPDKEAFAIDKLLLRYIDSFELNEEDDLLGFLNTNLKIGISYPTQLFDDVPIENKPTQIKVRSAYLVESPKGTIDISMSSGRHRKEKVILMDTQFFSGKDELPEMPDGFNHWVEEAHKLTDDWFFKLIEGDFERRFEDA